MLRPGDLRRQLAQRLNSAYADGLLSQDTFSGRLDQVLDSGLIDPRRLVGDLSFRASRQSRWFVMSRMASTHVRRWTGRATAADDDGSQLLALDWTGDTVEVVVGRHWSCDVVLSSDDVSRRHARILFRDGNWILQDLKSTNGTFVNGVRVGRCRLRPGDRVCLGTQEVRID